VWTNEAIGPIDLLAFKGNQARAICVLDEAPSDELQHKLIEVQREFPWFNVLSYVLSGGSKIALVFCTDPTRPYRSSEDLTA